MEKLTLKQWRLIKGKTLKDMADACGVHPNTYMRYEADPAKIPLGIAGKIAAELGESVDALFSDLFFA